LFINIALSLSIYQLYVTVIVLPFSFTNFPSGKMSSLCCMVIGYSIYVVNININIMVLHTDHCENNMQKVWVFGLWNIYVKIRWVNHFVSLVNLMDVLPPQHSPNLILWAYVIDVKYLFKSVAYWMSVI
jgi:hypothetical protein